MITRYIIYIFSFGFIFFGCTKNESSKSHWVKMRLFDELEQPITINNLTISIEKGDQSIPLRVQGDSIFVENIKEMISYPLDSADRFSIVINNDSINISFSLVNHRVQEFIDTTQWILYYHAEPFKNATTTCPTFDYDKTLPCRYYVWHTPPGREIGMGISQLFPTKQ